MEKLNPQNVNNTDTQVRVLWLPLLVVSVTPQSWDLVAFQRRERSRVSGVDAQSAVCRQLIN